MKDGCLQDMRCLNVHFLRGLLAISFAPSLLPAFFNNRRTLSRLKKVQTLAAGEYLHLDIRSLIHIIVQDKTEEGGTSEHRRLVARYLIVKPTPVKTGFVPTPFPLHSEVGIVSSRHLKPPQKVEFAHTPRSLKNPKTQKLSNHPPKMTRPP